MGEIAREISLQFFLKQMYRKYSEADRRFCFILGAGASRNSGIRTGEQLMREWFRELHKDGIDVLNDRIDILCTVAGKQPDNYKKYCDPNYSLNNEDYFDIYDLCFAGMPEVGFARLEKEMEDKNPSCGYYPLAAMLTNTKNKLVITTNFDSLVEDAIFLYSTIHPMVISHESLAPFIKKTQDFRRPVIAKMHRDLFFDPLNRKDELRKPAEEWREPICTALKKYIPIVIGYAGGDNTLMELLGETELSDGIYWCYVGKKPSLHIRELVAKKDGYLVEIPGFDEMMYQMGEVFCEEIGLEDPLDLMNRKIRNQWEKYCNSLLDVQKEVSGNTEFAVKQYAQRTIRVLPRLDEISSAEDATRRGMCEFLLEEYHNAICSFDKAIALGENTTIVYNNRGNALVSLGRYEEAVADFSKAIDLDSESIVAYNNRGCALVNLKDYEKALFDLNKAVELDPENASIYRNRGNALSGLKRYEEAMADYNRSIELEPRNASVYYNRGNMLESLKRYEEAMADYNRSIELEPQNASVYYNCGNALANLKRYEEAVSNYSKAIELAPENADAYNNRGCLLADLKKYEEAICDFDVAIELNPEHTDAYYNRGKVFSELGQYEKAVSDFNKAIEFDSEDVAAYYSRGRAFYNLGKYEQLISDYNRVNELIPEDSTVYNCRSMAYYKLGKFEEAIEDANRAIELDLNSDKVTFKAANYDTRGTILTELGRYSDALLDFNKAIELWPDCSDIYANRAEVLRRLGRMDEAIADEERAKELQKENMLLES